MCPSRLHIILDHNILLIYAVNPHIELLILSGEKWLSLVYLWCGALSWSPLLYLLVR